MESRRKRSRGQIVKWICYALLGLLCAVLQTTPGLFQFGAAKPLWLLPLAGLAIVALYKLTGCEGMGTNNVIRAVQSGEAVSPLLVAGRTVGMLALELLLLCFAVSAVMQLYFKNSAANFALIASAAALLVLTLDWLFFYYMPGYSGAASRWLWFVLPTAALSVPVCFPLFGVVRRIHEEFKIDNGVV